MNVEIAIPSLTQYQQKSRVKIVLKNSWAAPSSTRSNSLQSYTEVTQYYPGCRLIYLPPSCSLALLQSSNSGRDTAQASTYHRQVQPSPLRGAPTATSLQPYRGSSSKHPRHAAGISLSSDTLFGLSVHLTTFLTVLLHYFFLAPSSFQLIAHTPRRSGCHHINVPVNAISCK